MKNVYKRFKVLFLAYFSFIGLLLVCVLFREKFAPYLDGSEKLNLGNGFYTSWLASLFEDILFFGCIGIIGMVLSTKLPQDENFNIRVDSIANGRKVGDRSRKFLNFSIRKLLVYNDTYSIKLVIKALDRSEGLAEIFAEISNVCTNMCKDVIYPLNTNAYVTPTHSFKGDFGYVSHLQIHEEGNLQNKNTLIDGEICKLTKDGFSKSTLFNVPANGAAIWKFCYCIWQRIGGDRNNEDDWYYIKTSGFAENLNITIINRTEYDLSYEFTYLDRSSPVEKPVIETDKLIKKADPDNETVVKLVQNIQAHHDDKFKLFLYLKIE